MFEIVSSLDRMYHSTLPVRYDSSKFCQMTKQSLKKIALGKGIKKNKLICVCISLSLMSFVTPQPSQSEKTFEFSRLKLETKAPRPLKLRVSHAPSHKQNKQTKKKEAKIHSS